MSNNNSAKTGSTTENLFLQNEPEQDISNLIINIEEIIKYCQSSNTDEILLPEKKPEVITIFCNNSSKNEKPIIFPKKKASLISSKSGLKIII